MLSLSLLQKRASVREEDSSGAQTGVLKSGEKLNWRAISVVWEVGEGGAETHHSG